MIALIAVTFAILFALTFGEFFVVQQVPRLLRFAGFSLASFRGDLAAPRAEIPTELAGLEVTRLDATSYLVEPHDAFSGGTRADANAYGLAFAIIKLDGPRWAMNVRANRGYQLIGLGAPLVWVWAELTGHLSTPGRVAALIFSALGPYAILKWRRSIRARFAAAAQELGARQPERVPAEPSSL